jgi:hypothetical protein
MVSKPLKYDLKNLNNQYSSTTVNPWVDLKNEYLPTSFSGNMLSAFVIMNNKQFVNEKQVEESSLSNTLSQEKIENVNYSDYVENPDQKLKVKPGGKCIRKLQIQSS